jgi:hypothetical protein
MPAIARTMSAAEVADATCGKAGVRLTCVLHETLVAVNQHKALRHKLRAAITRRMDHRGGASAPRQMGSPIAPFSPLPT